MIISVQGTDHARPHQFIGPTRTTGTGHTVDKKDQMSFNLSIRRHHQREEIVQGPHIITEASRGLRFILEGDQDLPVHTDKKPMIN